MNLLNKYVLFCALLFIFVPVTLSSLTGEITATDWTYRHSLWIGQYLQGDFSPIFIYPPLFEWIMLLFVAISFPMHLFQILFAVLSTFGILFMASKQENEKTVLIVAVLLACSIAYVEFASALMPQALDYLLFPIAVVFYFKDRVKISVILTLAVFFMHGTGYIFLLIFFLYSIFRNRKKETLIFGVLLLLLAPLFYYWQFGVKDYWYIWDMEAQAEWESRYLEPVWNFFFFSGFMTWVLLPIACKKLYKGNFKLTESQVFYIVWFLSFIPMIIFRAGLWRTFSYMIVPLSLLVASAVSEK